MLVFLLVALIAATSGSTFFPIVLPITALMDSWHDIDSLEFRGVIDNMPISFYSQAALIYQEASLWIPGCICIFSCT